MKTLIIIFMLFVITGCEDSNRQIKESELKTETAEVITMTYVPYRSSASISPGFNMAGSGGLVMSISRSSFPEVYATCLRCSEHKKTFCLDGKNLFNNVKIGDILILEYVDEIEFIQGETGTERIIDQHTKRIQFPNNTTLTRY